MQRSKPVLGLAILVVAATLSAAADSTPPSPAQVRQAVARFFANVPGYRDGDLIDRTQVETLLLVELKAIGCQVPHPEAIAARVLEADAWLVSQFRTPAGRAFMRQISRYPGVYDRLDRLSRMPHGQQTIRDLVRAPDGYKMLEYLTTQKGGREMGRMLSQAPDAAGFNRPTGRIYTGDGLLAEIEKALRPVKARGGPT